MKSKSLLLLLFISVFFACDSKQASPQHQSSPYEDLLVFPDSDANQGSDNEPQIRFQATEFDFGNVIQKEKVEHKFQFTNTGKKDLYILDTETSCGCTVPYYSK